jgi:large subunit ribosomal protein L10e
MKAHNYRKPKRRAYSRKKYIRGSQVPKIVKFTMGNIHGNFDYEVSLISKKEVQVQHNALESLRITVNRFLEKKLGKDYCFRILSYPHHVLRENKMIFGAHADRLQDGMRGAFGKSIGTAARVKANQPIVKVNVNENGIEVAKTALKRGGNKVPSSCRLEVMKIEEL